MQIARPIPGPDDALCTLGFNALRDGVAAFITNGHCTYEVWPTDGTPFYQAWVRSADSIGAELVLVRFLSLEALIGVEDLVFLGGSDPSGGVRGRPEGVFAVRERQEGRSLRMRGMRGRPVRLEPGQRGLCGGGLLPVYAGFNFNLRRAMTQRLCVTTADQTYARKCSSPRQLQRPRPKQRLR